MKSLWNASIDGENDLMREILQKIEDQDAVVNYQDETFQSTPLMNCAYRNNISGVKILLKHGADVNLQDKIKWTALMMSAYKGFSETSQLLLDAKPNVELQNEDGWTALMMAAHPGYIDIVRMIMRANPNLDVQNKSGVTALMLAASRGRTDIAKLLIAAGANVNVRDKSGEPGILPKPRILESDHPYKNNMRDYTPIEIPGADSYIIQFDERTSTEMDEDYLVFYKGWTYREAQGGEVKYSGGFKGSEKNFPGVNNRPPLEINDKKFIVHFCTDYRNVDWGYKFTIFPVFRKSNSESGWNALVWAAYKGQTSVAEQLVKAGIQIDVQGWDGKTALAWALERNHEGTAVFLLKHGARLDCPDKEGVTPIEKAVANQMNEFVSQVFDNFEPFHGTDSKIKPSCAFVWTYLLANTEDHRDDICRVLDRYPERIKALADVEDIGGRSAIGIARQGYKSVIMERLYFYKRYEFIEGPPAHKSSTCMVIIAKDHGDNERFVALKFMANKNQFLRELDARKDAEFHDRYVISTITSYNGDENKEFLADASMKGLYYYCIVMPAAERNLQDIISHEHISNREWDRIAGMTKELVKAVNHMHTKGYVHGDVKPMNIVRSDGRLKLIDLDGAANIENHDYIGEKYSSAYLPPEMIALIGRCKPNEFGLEVCSDEDVDTDQKPRAFVRTYRVSSATGLPEMNGVYYELMRAHQAHDVWCLGATLYQLCTGECLFNSNDEGNIDQKQLITLFEWTDVTKQEKLQKVSHPSARNLLSRMLTKEPTKRPDTLNIIYHPFLTGKKAVRMIGDKAKYDFFISYREASDSVHARKMYELLTKLDRKVYLDKECLKRGQNWEEGFCDGLVDSRIFIPLISREAILHPSNTRQNFLDLKEISPCDNVFLELRMALELKNLGLIESICPVMIGDILTDTPDFNYMIYSKFTELFTIKFPEVTINTVDNKMKEHLDRQGLGYPMNEKATVKTVMSAILSHQGEFIEGKSMEAFHSVALKLAEMVDTDPTNLRDIKPFLNRTRSSVVGGSPLRRAISSDTLPVSSADTGRHHSKLTTSFTVASKLNMLKQRARNNLTHKKVDFPVIEEENIHSKIIEGLKQEVSRYKREVEDHLTEFKIQQDQINELKKVLTRYKRQHVVSSFKDTAKTNLIKKKIELSIRKELSDALLTQEVISPRVLIMDREDTEEKEFHRHNNNSNNNEGYRVELKEAERTIESLKSELKSYKLLHKI